MVIKILRVKTYVSSTGKDVFNQWLIGLRDRQARSIIRTKIDRLRLGLFGVYKSVGEGVLELKIYFGPGYRIYFGFDGSEIIILLCGGDKSTQNGDIQHAKEYWKNYRRQKNEQRTNP